MAIENGLPMTRAFNHLVAGRHFARRFRRWPLPPQAPGALINDVIFDLMIDPQWSALQRAFVDKDTAKAEAHRLAPNLLAPETLAVLPVEAVGSIERLFHALAPYRGLDAVAKPTHASGGVTFMRNVEKPADLRPLVDLAAMDYASLLREMQYWQLPRKVIVEAMIPTPANTPPDDYKFHCIDGEPLLCQIDHNRFGKGWNRLFRLPDFAPMDPDDGLVAPPTFTMAPADRLSAMMAAARRLAAPFGFVRVDLYDGADGVYFGELTFTPAAALGIAPCSAGDHWVNATHQLYSRTLMDALALPAATGSHTC